MKNKIMIDGITYVPEKNITENKESNAGLMSPEGYMLLFNAEKDINDDYPFPVPRLRGFKFKRNGFAIDFKQNYRSQLLVSKFGTIISKEWLERAEKIIKLVLRDGSKNPLDFSVYEVWDEATKSFLKDHPVLFIYNFPLRNIGVILAPRIDEVTPDVP